MNNELNIQGLLKAYKHSEITYDEMLEMLEKREQTKIDRVYNVFVQAKTEFATHNDILVCSTTNKEIADSWIGYKIKNEKYTSTYFETRIYENGNHVDTYKEI